MSKKINNEELDDLELSSPFRTAFSLIKERLHLSDSEASTFLHNYFNEYIEKNKIEGFSEDKILRDFIKEDPSEEDLKNFKDYFDKKNKLDINRDLSDSNNSLLTEDELNSLFKEKADTSTIDTDSTKDEVIKENNYEPDSRAMEIIMTELEYNYDEAEHFLDNFICMVYDKLLNVEELNDIKSNFSDNDLNLLKKHVKLVMTSNVAVNQIMEKLHLSIKDANDYLDELYDRCNDYKVKDENEGISDDQEWLEKFINSDYSCEELQQLHENGFVYKNNDRITQLIGSNIGGIEMEKNEKQLNQLKNDNNEIKELLKHESKKVNSYTTELNKGFDNLKKWDKVQREQVNNSSRFYQFSKLKEGLDKKQEKLDSEEFKTSDSKLKLRSQIKILRLRLLSKKIDDNNYYEWVNSLLALDENLKPGASKEDINNAYKEFKEWVKHCPKEMVNSPEFRIAYNDLEKAFKVLRSKRAKKALDKKLGVVSVENSDNAYKKGKIAIGITSATALAALIIAGIYGGSKLGLFNKNNDKDKVIYTVEESDLDLNASENTQNVNKINKMVGSKINETIKSGISKETITEAVTNTSGSTEEQVKERAELINDFFINDCNINDFTNEEICDVINFINGSYFSKATNSEDAELEIQNVADNAFNIFDTYGTHLGKVINYTGNVTNNNDITTVMGLNTFIMKNSNYSWVIDEASALFINAFTAPTREESLYYSKLFLLQQFELQNGLLKDPETNEEISFDRFNDGEGFVYGYMANLSNSQFTTALFNQLAEEENIDLTKEGEIEKLEKRVNNFTFTYMIDEEEHDISFQAIDNYYNPNCNGEESTEENAWGKKYNNLLSIARKNRNSYNNESAKASYIFTFNENEEELSASALRLLI